MFISRCGFSLTIILVLLFTAAIALVHGQLPQPLNSFAARAAIVSGALDQGATPFTSPQLDRDSVTAVPVLLKRMGCTPREITGPKGNYLFSVGNQSGEREVVFQLVRENGQRLHEKQIRHRGRWRQLVHLTPGTYFLREAHHPEWTCKITITSH